MPAINVISGNIADIAKISCTVKKFKRYEPRYDDTNMLNAVSVR